MVNLLNKADTDLAAQLLRVLDGRNAATYSEKRLESLLSSVRELNAKAYRPVMDALNSELRDYADHEAGYQYQLFEQTLPEPVLAKLPLQRVPLPQLHAAATSQPFQGRLLKEWGSKLEADRMQRISNAVRMGYLQGETVETIVRRVVGTKAANREDAAIQPSRRDLAVVTRTAINHMAANARNQFAEENKRLVKSKQWCSTLDSSTSHWCIVRDNLMYTLKGEPIGHQVPYLAGPGKIHFCCRSTEILITRSAAELDIDDTETRASMDGQVPANVTYKEWLQDQPYSRLEDVLGITRARLVEQGKLKVPDLYSDKGEFLTLDQLKAKDAAAFEEYE